MKKYILIALGVLTIQSCMVTSNSYISENYIKTNIQEHIPDKFSKLETNEIYTNSNIEFTAFLTEDKEGLLIRGVKYYSTPKIVESERVVYEESNFVILELKDMRKIIAKLQSLKDMATSMKVEDLYELNYVDYTVSNDLFISYQKDVHSFDSLKYIYLWISSLKYTVESDDFLEILKESIVFIEKENLMN